MNYRARAGFSGVVGINITGAAIDAANGVYGTLDFARAHIKKEIDDEIERLQQLKREWLHMPEKKLPIDTEAAHEEGSGQ